MKRVFGLAEAVFNIFYLAFGGYIGIFLLTTYNGNLTRLLAGIMSMVLIFGDSFHLIPRISLIISNKEEKLRAALGRGKQITSIGMTIFYLFLWHIGLLIYMPANAYLLSSIIYILAIIRIALCILPQNEWTAKDPSLSFGIYRNIPFFMQGLFVAWLFFVNRNYNNDLKFIWLAIILSFVFYLPVVLWVHKNPKIGMLMIPKTFAYIYLLLICIYL